LQQSHLRFGLAQHSGLFCGRAAQDSDYCERVAGALENTGYVLQILRVQFQPDAVACHRDFSAVQLLWSESVVVVVVVVVVVCCCDKTHSSLSCG
jgi:hypothetical protein